MSDTADRATLTAKLEEAQQRIAELEYSVRLLRSADETAESLAADLTRATQRVADLEQERDRFRAECEQLRSEWNTLAEQAERLTGANIVRTAELRSVIGEMHARVAELESRRCENCAHWSDDGGEGKCEEPPSWTCGAFRRKTL